ncbi:MAG: DegT/DnrJ/EryC1/StrS family aminotransferase [Acetobacteraceae bacterium]|nr:DegT/DnrJ/EryC1/StrS family aminotransferase [Acetobacteraceae bacterium]
MVLRKPSLLGGRPAFVGRGVPVARPTLPEPGLLMRGLVSILTGDSLTNGPTVQELERRAASYAGVPHAVAVSSCTAGLTLTLRCLGLEGEVILPSFTFCATAHAAAWNGLVPVFADIDPHTWNLDPRRVEEAVTPRTSAIVAVHVFGNPCAVEELEAIARRFGLALVVDAAHAFGSRRGPRPVGCAGAAEVFSLSPTKVLVAGEGGLVTTRDPALAARLRDARNYGHSGDYDCHLVGMNARMGEMNALLARAGLELLEVWLARRERLVGLYREALNGLDGIEFQSIRPEDRSTFKDLTVCIDPDRFGLSRDELAVALEAEGISTKKYFYPPVHEQAVYRGRGLALHPPGLPVTARVSRRALSLPLYSHMPEEEIAIVAGAIRDIHREREAVRRWLRDHGEPGASPAHRGGVEGGYQVLPAV